MSQNLRLAEYFTSEFYKNKTHQLAHIASPNFEFVLNNRGKKNFEEYAIRTTLVGRKSDIEIGEFTSTDDHLFKAACTITKDDGSTASGQMKLHVDHGLLQKVQLDYDLTTDEYLEFEKTMID